MIFLLIHVWDLWEMECNFLMFNISITVMLEIFQQTNKQMARYASDLLHCACRVLGSQAELWGKAAMHDSQVTIW